MRSLEIARKALRQINNHRELIHAHQLFREQTRLRPPLTGCHFAGFCASYNDADSERKVLRITPLTKGRNDRYIGFIQVVDR